MLFLFTDKNWSRNHKCSNSYFSLCFLFWSKTLICYYFINLNYLNSVRIIQHWGIYLLSSCLNISSVCDAQFLRSHQQFLQAPAPLNTYPNQALTELTPRLTLLPTFPAGPMFVIEGCWFLRNLYVPP
jgi:hypothetical protein